VIATQDASEPHVGVPQRPPKTLPGVQVANIREHPFLCQTKFHLNTCPIRDKGGRGPDFSSLDLTPEKKDESLEFFFEGLVSLSRSV